MVIEIALRRKTIDEIVQKSPLIVIEVAIHYASAITNLVGFVNAIYKISDCTQHRFFLKL